MLPRQNIRRSFLHSNGAGIIQESAWSQQSTGYGLDFDGGPHLFSCRLVYYEWVLVNRQTTEEKLLGMDWAIPIWMVLANFQIRCMVLKERWWILLRVPRVFSGKLTELGIWGCNQKSQSSVLNESLHTIVTANMIKETTNISSNVNETGWVTMFN